MTLDEAIKTISEECKTHNACIECPMNENCNEYPGEWKETKGGAVGMNEYELCWQTGAYDDNCFCMLCPHRDECSGSGQEDDE